jgi:hypothetical protein
MTAPGAASDEPVRTTRAGSASALGRDVARAAAGDPGFAWALGLGVVLIGLGLLGFVPNPLVGAPSVAWGTPLLVTGDSHDVVHLVGGAIALHAALGLSRARRDSVLIALGAVSLVLLVLGILDGRWLGVVPYPVGLADQLLHLVVGLGCILVGLAGRGTSAAVPGVAAMAGAVTAPEEVASPSVPAAADGAAPDDVVAVAPEQAPADAAEALAAAPEDPAVEPEPVPASSEEPSELTEEDEPLPS